MSKNNVFEFDNFIVAVRRIVALSALKEDAKGFFVEVWVEAPIDDCFIGRLYGDDPGGRYARLIKAFKEVA